MIILLGFAFFAGVITVLAPCILPILPLILSGASLGGRKRALGIVLGVVLAFSVFTLTLSWLVQHAGFSPNVSRDIGIVLLLALGLLMLIPAWLERFEGWISARVTIQANGQQTGFWGGLILGVSLGAVWTPCAGPILASVTAVTTTGHLTGQAVLVTIFYALGSAIPMALIVLLGQKIITRLAWLKAHGRHIQQFFGIILIIMAGLILTNTDRKVQNAIVRATPNWLSGLQKFEERAPGMPKAQTATNASTDNHTVKLENFGPAPELTGTQGWINSQPLKLSDLRGKVVLVKFWTFSCINCIRTLPYAQAWYNKYHDKGFEIIAVHTPEFAFEKELSNVRRAVKDFKITYPVVQDNDYATWNAYSNQYWPAKYFVDASGNIRYVHFGEGKYDEQELVIQELLQEAGKDVLADKVPEEKQALPSKITPETYFGSARLKRLASPEKVSASQQLYSAPTSLKTDAWALQGPWSVFDEYAVAGINAELRFRFTAKTMYIVMAPETTAQRVDMYIDGQPSQNVNVASSSVDAPAIYQVATFDAVGAHDLHVVFPHGGARIYAATFGASDAPGVYCDQSGKCAVKPLP